MKNSQKTSCQNKNCKLTSHVKKKRSKYINAKVVFSKKSGKIIKIPTLCTIFVEIGVNFHKSLKAKYYVKLVEGGNEARPRPLLRFISLLSILNVICFPKML